MAEINETALDGYPNIIPFDSSQKIIEQMKKDICKIKIGEEQGTGFFCKIPLQIVITCYLYSLQIIM